MSIRNEAVKQKALDTLTHYFKSAYQRTGLSWNADNEAEIQDALLDLIRAVIEQESE